MRRLMVLIICAFGTSFARAGENISLPDILIESNGTTKDLGALTSPYNCVDGAFSMTIEVQRKTGINDLLFSVIDANANRFDFVGSDSKNFSRLPPKVDFKNFNTGEYDQACRCFKNPGSAASIRITNIVFHPEANNKNCRLEFNGRFLGGNYWASELFGNSFKGIGIRLKYTINIPDHFFKSDCNQIWIKDADKNNFYLDPLATQPIELTLPAALMQKAICISPRKNISRQDDYFVRLEIIGPKHENN